MTLQHWAALNYIQNNKPCCHQSTSTACHSQDFLAAQVKQNAATAGTGYFLLLRRSCDGDSQTIAVPLPSLEEPPGAGTRPSRAAAAATGLAHEGTAVGEEDGEAKLVSQAPACFAYAWSWSCVKKENGLGRQSCAFGG